jgi:hypothetical protein
MQACSQFSRLPEALLARILQALPQRDRLVRCATVCTSWAAAATAATVHVEHPFMSPEVDTVFNPWLQRHAGQLESLKVTPQYWTMVKLCLPCGELQRLTRLDVAHCQCDLQLKTASEGGHDSSSMSPARVLPKLEHLKLVECQLDPSMLPQLSGVTRLKLCEQGSPDEAATINHMLQRLPNVTSLSLFYEEDAAEIIAALATSSLTSLSLRLHPERHRTGTGFLSNAPFAHLQKLKLRGAQVDPEVLSCMSLLTRLQLSNCGLSPLQQPSGAGVDGVTAFLAVVGGLRHLKHLSVCADVSGNHRRQFPSWQFGIGNLVTAQPCDCASLTASPHLTNLEFHPMAKVSSCQQQLCSTCFLPAGSFLTWSTWRCAGRAAAPGCTTPPTSVKTEGASPLQICAASSAPALDFTAFELGGSWQRTLMSASCCSCRPPAAAWRLLGAPLTNVQQA